MVPLSLSRLTQTLLRAVTGVPQACTSRPFQGRAAQRLANHLRRRRAANGGGFIFCVPPLFPPVTTRFVLDAGGHFALPRPPISRRAPFPLRLRCSARRR
ncbi:hypothetical protein D7X33_16890 [Butyricicoccus sp. 1XD8-22]|nr:hypothetical protein D7X33_16890 [Butyricicoccus sp. 1XD8-22]